MKRKKNFSTILYMVCLSVFMASCSNENEFVNLSSTLSSEAVEFSIIEGNSVVLNYNLSEELSEDLPLQLSISTDEVKSFINPEDYNSTTVYFKGNLDEEWRTGGMNNIFFPKKNTSLKIRIETIDDDIIEPNESFHADIKVNQTNNINFMLMDEELEPTLVNVKDNDMGISGELPSEGIMVFDVDDDLNFKLVDVKQDQPISRFEKYLIDYVTKNGMPEAMKKDLRTMLTSGVNTTIRRFVFPYDPSGGLGGFVYFDDVQLQGWYIGLNLYYAYSHPDVKSITEFEEAFKNYNENGIFGYLLAHEYGHIATLNFETQVDRSISEEDCGDYYLPEGCLRTESVMNTFYNTFYKNESKLFEPRFVTDYAASVPPEDIAESFAFSLGQEIIPELNDFSSGALRKIHFVKDHEAFADFDYRGLRDKINMTIHEDRGHSPILNYTTEGEHISCLDHERAKKAFRNSRKKRFEK